MPDDLDPGVEERPTLRHLVSMSKTLPTLLVSCGLGLLVIAGVGLLIQRESTPQALAVSGKNQSAPAWSLTALDGKNVSLSDFKGRVVLMNFWATWCPPCREEMPQLIALQKDLGKAGLTVVGISMDQEKEAASAYVTETGIEFPIVMGTESVARVHGVSILPTSFLIDREGRIAQTILGPRTYTQLADLIKPLL